MNPADCRIKKWLRDHLNIEICEKKLDLLMEHKNIVLEKNKFMNLTAITDENEFITKHIIDSFTLLPLIPNSSEVIDVGTGAGFPGVVLKIMREDIKMYLMDSKKKRVDFLEETLKNLEISGVILIHGRSNEWVNKNQKRFGVCTARAVADLGKLVSLTFPLLRKGGFLLAMKGPDVQEEMNKAKPIIKMFGGFIADITPFEIDRGIKRSVVKIAKQ